MFQSAITADCLLQTQAVPTELSVVVPTLNEAGNIYEFLNRLEVALAGLSWEAVFVDDNSSDGTADLLREIGRVDRRVRVLQRVGRRGLASAVIEGMLAASAPVIAVMDADLQHDQNCLPQLFAAVHDGEHDLAVGSRYVGNGGVGQWDAGRHQASLWATRLAQRLLKAPLSDPMSGFFVVTRRAFMASLPRLSGGGFKILLDIVSSAPTPLKIAEVPYVFGVRQAGESKLDAMVVAEYFKLIADKALGQVVPITLLLFLLVGGLGVGVHLGVLGATMAIGLPFAVAQSLAVLTAMTFNYTLNNTFTYRDRRLRGSRFVTGLFGFYLVCLFGAVANVGIGSYVYDANQSWWVAGITGSLIGAVWNYAASSTLIWRK